MHFACSLQQRSDTIVSNICRAQNTACWGWALINYFGLPLGRFGARLAGRMAPRYARDQLAGATQLLAFPSGDGLLTDTVAR